MDEPVSILPAARPVSLRLERGAKTARMRLLSLLFALLALAVIFLVPYHVPMQPTASFSYHFGYNNRAGVALLLLCVAGVAVWTRGLGMAFSNAQPSSPVPRKFLFASLLAVVLGCAAMYALAGRFGGFGESSYNIDRAWLLLGGKSPYTGFEWPFGPYFLYFPVLLCRAFSLDVATASYLVWCFTFLLGVTLLFAAVNLVDYPSGKRTAIFLLLMTAAYPDLLSMGTPGALLRHVAAIFSILLVQRVLSRNPAPWNLSTAAVAGVCALALLLISPEVATSFAFACVCVFALKRRPSVVLLLLEFGVILFAAKQSRVLDTMLASAGGADSLPIIPSPHIFLFFAALLVCGSYLYRRFADGRLDDNTVGVLAYSLPMLAPALGRADAPHVFLDGLGVFLVALFYISRYRQVWKWSCLAFFIFIALLPTVTGVWFYTPYLGSVFFDTLEESNHSRLIERSFAFAQSTILPHLNVEKRAKWEARLEAVRARESHPGSRDLAELYPQWQGKFLAPFGYRPNGLGSDLTGRVEYGYYEGLENANTAAAMKRKVGELAAQPDLPLLLPEHFRDDCVVNGAWERRIMLILFFAPYRAPIVHPENVHGAVCQYIDAHYRQESAASPGKYGYQLWVNKNLGAR